MSKTILIPFVMAILLLFGCTSTPPQPPPGSNGTGIINTTNLSNTTTSPPPIPKNATVVLETNYGNITVELDTARAPITVANFLQYVNAGYYENTVFHRVIPGFVIQGGGFLPDGTPKIPRAPIKLEADNGLKNLNGTLAMARTSIPNSATSQFYINVADNEDLNPSETTAGYAVFGRVVSGMDTVQKIVNVSTERRGDYADWPSEPVTIIRVRVTG